MSDPGVRLSAALEDRYAIQREIGRGGAATVYLAEDLKHHRDVAVKVLDGDLTASVGADRFLREIETAAHLIHPNILPLFDSGQGDGLLYYVMPYVEGESLRVRLERDRQLPVEDAVRIAGEVADALAYAHDHGVVHRDVKPENILLEAGHAVLADFGVAHAVVEAREDRITKSGVSLGTPAYMSPEQAVGDQDLDGRTDQYGLACVLYEMLSGDPPFTASSPMAVVAKHVNERPPSLEVVRPDLPHELVSAVEKALTKAPADRFRTTSEFRSAIERASTGEVRVSRTGRPARRWRAPAGIAVAVAAALAGGLLLWPGAPELNQNLLMVFPLDVSGEVAPDETGRGEDNAYLIWNAMVGRGSLGWLNALLLVEDPRDISGISSRSRRALATDHGAGLYLHGRIILSGDAAQGYLTLHDVVSDAVVARADASSRRAVADQLGVRAVGELLLELFPEETVDVSVITGRRPEAVQTLLQAERHFYAGRFQQAYDAYCEAVDQDSAFALAAVKGAQAASWLHKTDDAQHLIGLALAHAEALAPRESHFAHGFHAFLESDAARAVSHFERAIAMDDQWPEAWTGLGEVYTHLLPRRAPQDSLARDAFTRVYERTHHSAPALFHLAEFAVREHDLRRTSDLLGQYVATEPDTAGYGLDKLRLMLRCAAELPSESEWRDQVLAEPLRVLEAARSLGVGGAYPDCAIEGYRAVVRHDTSSSRTWRFAAAVGLQSMLAATGRIDELQMLLDTTSESRSSLTPHYIIDALAGTPVEAQAQAEAEALRSGIQGLSDWKMWFLGVWDAHRDRLEEARSITDTMVARAARTDARRSRMVASSLRAHVALAEGDTSAAIGLLGNLSPTARRGALYYVWESLGFERLTLARLLLARGRYVDAYREATFFDSPGAANLILAVFLPASLEIRRDAARALGDERSARAMESRLSALRR